MSIFDVLLGRKPKTASIARDRLQIIIAQERVRSQTPDYLPTLQKELLEVLSKYVVISSEDIRVSHNEKNGVDFLELNIVLPDKKES